MWYVKVAKYGVINNDLTTRHRTELECMAWIAKYSRSASHLQVTSFFVGKDGEKAKEVLIFKQ